MNQLMVWPSCGLLIVGAEVTFAVNVVVNTFDNVQSTVIEVAENVTATGVVCAPALTVNDPVAANLALSVLFVAKTIG